MDTKDTERVPTDILGIKSWDDPALSPELREAARALYAKEVEWQKAFHKWQRAIDAGAQHRRTVLLYQQLQRIAETIRPLESLFWSLMYAEDKAYAEWLERKDSKPDNDKAADTD